MVLTASEDISLTCIQVISNDAGTKFLRTPHNILILHALAVYPTHAIFLEANLDSPVGAAEKVNRQC